MGLKKLHNDTIRH